METRTIEEIVLPLALRMVPCPRCDGGKDDNCNPRLYPYPTDSVESCHGTGQVAEFPGLRRHWEEPHTHVAVFDPYARYDHSKSIILDSEHPDIVAECEANRRRGWLPVTTTDALLEAGKRYGFWLNWSEALKHWVVAEANLLLGLKVVGTGETPNLALALALEAAWEQEDADASR